MSYSNPTKFIMRRLGRGGWILFLCTLYACTSAPPPPPPQAPPPPPKPQGPQFRMSQGLLQLGAACESQGSEECNAIDDNCDGVIDEGCGYETGGVQVTISWNTGADIDLYVTDPSGEKVFYNEEKRHTAAGGVLDYDSRGDCREEQKLNNIENAYWPSPAPKGHYSIEIHYFGPCGDSVPTTVTLGVAFNGKPAGHFQYNLSPEERVTALEFDVE